LQATTISFQKSEQQIFFLCQTVFYLFSTTL